MVAQFKIDDKEVVGECLILFFAFFDTIVCFIVYTGCNPHNTQQGVCVGRLVSFGL